MAFNPMDLLQMKERLQVFRQDHPKFVPFLGAVKEHALFKGTVMEIKFTTPEGREYVSNIRMNRNDIETIGMLINH